MKKLLTVILTIVLALSMVSFTMAFEENHPAQGYNRGIMGTDSKPWREVIGNTIVLPGATSNAYETRISPVEPTGVNVVLVPDESGTLITNCSDSIFTSGAITNGADGTILISNGVGTGTSLWQTHTLTGPITGTMTNTGALATTIINGADASMLISSDAGTGAWITITNDVTFTNAGISTIIADSVSTDEANINSVSLVIASGLDINTVAVEPGSTLMGWYITNAGAINGSTFMNTVEWDGTFFKATLNDVDGGNSTTFTGTFLRP